MKTRIFVVIALLVAGIGAAPSRAMDAPAACSLSAGSLPASPGLPELFPDPIQLTCNAQQFCYGTCSYIGCTGNSTCTVGATSVTCDGVQTNCAAPICTPPQQCADPCGYCQCLAHSGQPRCFLQNCTTP